MGLKSDAVIDRIRTRLGKIDPSKREVTHIYKCRISNGGKVVKTWMLDLKNVKLYEGDDSAECIIDFDDAAFADIADKKMDLEEAMGKQLVKVIEGDKALAVKLIPYIATV